MWALPCVRFTDPVTSGPLAQDILYYLLMGLAFTAIQTIIRPVLMLLTANLIVRTMGLFVIFVNAALFSILAYVLGGWHFSSPVVLWVIVASMVLAIVIVVLEMIIGLNSPKVGAGKQTSKFYWRWLGLLPKNGRNRIAENLRIVYIYDTVQSYAAQIVISMTPLVRFRRVMQRLIYRGKRVVIDESRPETVRLMLQELGPTYVKLGQMASSRSGMLPDAWLESLSKLQSAVDPFPYEEARRIITRELGAPPEEIFATFETTPLAAASMAQIHRATLPGGEEVVVKVQRPDINVTVRADLDVMRDGVRMLEARAKWVRDLDPGGLLDEFARNVVGELDYQNELYNVRRLKHNMEVFPEIQVPQVYSEYSTSRVMTMEFVRGVKVTDVAALDEAGIDRTELSRAFMRAMFKQVLLDGFFHADPHPGNVLVDLKTSRVIFLDMGMMGNLTKEQRLAVISLIWSLKERDPDTLARAALEMSTPSREIDKAAFKRDVEQIMNRYLLYSDSEPSLDEVMGKTLSMAQSHGLRVNHDLTLAVKSLVQCEGVIRVLSPNMPMLDMVFTEVQHLMKQRFTADSITDTLNKQAMGTAKDILQHIPKLKDATFKWLEQYERGRLTVYVETDDATTQRLDCMEKGINRSINRLTIGIVLVGLIIGAAITATVSGWSGWSGPSDILFTIAGVIAGGLLIHMVWTRWRRYW